MNQNDLDELIGLTGEPIVAAERCAMGFENRTDRVILANGETRILQRISNADMAAHKIRLARLLPDRLADHGLRAPHLLKADAKARPPFLVREYVAGETGATLLASNESAIQLAETMGAVLPKLAHVQTEGLGLNTAWANPSRVVAQAGAQLARRRDLISQEHTERLHESITSYVVLFANRGGVFAHGDFCPVNVILDGGGWRVDGQHNPPPSTLHPPRINALLDLEFARLADPLFDAAWWGWVVRYHHEAQWHVAFPHLLAAAGIAWDDLTRQRIRTIQHLRLLEALDYNAALSPQRGAAWAERLAATLKWNN